MTIAEPAEGSAGLSGLTDEDVIGGDAVEGSYWRHATAALVSPGALAISAFTLAASGLFTLIGPLALIPTFAFRDSTSIETARNLSCLGIGIELVGIALAMWSLLRPESGPQWPRIVAGAAAVVGLLVILQYAVVLIMAANAAPPGAIVD